ncbi:heavy-metal-associated domain-containing protein [Sphingomicrobium marinum]|uniref:heavy-metal-associated domain-containing protein n=1 Tax=Sphingomicrobium marinum TaxID=1227950 RepID=UPI00223FE069|nr:heavy-metal-associated domain-containing protein [Sphingomicrobium marinum]
MSGYHPILRPVVWVILLMVLGGVAVAQMESGDRGIPPIASEGLLDVGGIEVDVGGETAQEARLAGWRIAQREGFAKLWASNSGRPASQAPRLSDSTLDSLVSAIVVEEERIGPKRYIARLGVQFDRQRASQYVGLSGARRRSAPMLLVPVIATAGMEFSMERRNPWQAAWAQYRTAATPIDYIRLSGVGSDPLLVNAAAVRRKNARYWKSVADFYGANNILIAQVQLHHRYPGGPATGNFAAFYGLDREPLGSFTLTSEGEDGVPAMMNEGVERMNGLFAAAFRRGTIKADPNLIIQEAAPPPIEEVIFAEIPFQIQLVSPSAADYDAGVGMLRAIPGVTAVTETSLAIGGTSNLVITYRGTADGLRSAIGAAGWSAEYSGGALRVSRPGA